MTLVLLMTVASGAWADIAVGNVFKTGSTIDFGTTSVRYKTYSGSSDNSTLGATGKQTLTYQQYTNGKHWFNISTGSGDQSIYIVSDNTAEPWGIRVSGGEGTMGNPYSFEVLFEEQVSLSINNNKDEATFTMPASDATVSYDIVRDLAVQMTTKVGDAADGADYRIRLRKKDNAWELADIELDALKALITVTDGIENVNIACFGQDAVCTLQIFAIDDNDQPTGDAISFANLEPGRYKAKAVAKADGDYIGETALSNVIVLFQGYEVTVPAGEMITYYKDENLKLEENSGAQLYTITAVADGKATATELTISPANTAILVKNLSDTETKTFLLIPTEETADNVTAYAGFTGTLEATTIPASTDNQTNYAFNGKQFVYVKNSIDVAANKAWLEVGTPNSARTLTIVFDDSNATGLKAIDNGQLIMDNDDWYDLNGRKLNAAPKRKGVYIKNGKKVVVK